MAARVPDLLRELVRRRPRLRSPTRRVRKLVRRGAPPRSAAPRRVDLTLPAPPGVHRASHPRAVLTLTARRGLYLPRRLAQVGLAGHEPQSLAAFLAAMEHAGPGAVLDVGANIGLYAAVASGLGNREDVWAFEPTPELADTARRFAADNGLSFQVETLAVAARDGTATLYLSDTADTSNSLRAGFRRSSRQLEVPVTTLDEWCARHGVRPAVIKIDTESTEADIVRGGARTVAEHRPYLLCEVLRNREAALAEAMRPFGYHWYHLSGDPPYRPTGTLVGDPDHRDLMYLFAPEPPSDTFWSAVCAWTDALTGRTAHPSRR